MERDSRGVVIKPPMEDVTAGRVFKPDRMFYYKEWFGVTVAWVFFWFCALGCLALGAWIGATDSGSPNWIPVFWTIFYDWFPAVNFWYWVLTAFWWRTTERWSWGPGAGGALVFTTCRLRRKWPTRF